MRAFAAAALLCGAGCTRADRAAEATATLREHCGACHVPSSPSARSKALAVFDLTQPGWWRALTSAQLATSADMLDGRMDLTDAELAEFFAGWGTPRRPSEAQRRGYRRFVEALRADASP